MDNSYREYEIIGKKERPNVIGYFAGSDVQLLRTVQLVNTNTKERVDLTSHDLTKGKEGSYVGVYYPEFSHWNEPTFINKCEFDRKLRADYDEYVKSYE